MQTTELPPSPVAWRIVGRNAHGRIVAQEQAEHLPLVHRVANSWRSSGMTVSVEPIHASEAEPRK